MTMLSMTGFGKAEAVFGGRYVLSAEVGSVNRKQLEVRCSLPPECGFFEERVRKIAARYISRGALQVRMTIHGRDGGVSGSPWWIPPPWSLSSGSAWLFAAAALWTNAPSTWRDC